jgi:ankyrin
MENIIMRNILFAIIVIGILATSAIFFATHELSGGQEKFCNAISKGEIKTVRDMLEKQPELVNTIYGNTGPKSFPRSALCLALEEGQPEIAKLLVSKGADVKVNFGRTPLQSAVYHNYTDLIPLLVEHGDNPSLAIRMAHFSQIDHGGDAGKIMKILLDHGANANYRGISVYGEANSTPLHEIAYQGDVKITEILISHGADVNAINSRGETPLHLAAQWCHPEVVRLLLEHHADVNAIDRNKRTPLENLIIEHTDSRGIPAKPEFYETIKILIAHGSHFTATDLAHAGDLEGLKSLLQKDPKQINKKDYWRDPLLFCAIREGHTDVAEYLIRQDADVDAVGKYGNPALHAAAYAGNIATVKLLLHEGVDVNREGKHGELALHWAASRPVGKKNDKEDSYDKIAQMLIESGSSLNVAAQEDRPDIWLAVGDENPPINQIDDQMKVLERRLNTNKQIQYMAPIRLAFGVGDTPLHSAAHAGRINIVACLIKAGAEIDCKNSHEQTPLHYAIAFEHPRIVECLLKAGADPKTKMSDGTSALELAYKVGNKQIIDLLKAR